MTPSHSHNSKKISKLLFWRTLVNSCFWRSPIISYLWLTSLTCSECQISQHWEYISFLGPNVSGMRKSILILMLNQCYFVVILIFWEVLGSYGSLLSGYYWLLLVTARYCPFPLLVWTLQKRCDENLIILFINSV